MLGFPCTCLRPSRQTTDCGHRGPRKQMWYRSKVMLLLIGEGRKKQFHEERAEKPERAVKTHGNDAKSPKLWVLRPAPLTLCNRLWALRTKETDVTSSLQRYAALMRLEPEEKVYEERSRGESSCWTKIMKSSPAVAEPSGFVFQVSRSSVHQDINANVIISLFAKRQHLDNMSCGRHASRFQNTDVVVLHHGHSLCHHFSCHN